MDQKTYFIKTYGCQMNLRDSEIIAQILSANGYVETSDMENSDLVLLNTCSIRAKAEQKAMSQLGALRKNKKAKPSMQICVAGCVAQQEGEKIREKMPHVDLIVGTQNIYSIDTLLKKSIEQGPITATNLDDKYSIPQFIPDIKGQPATENFRKFVTIMQGCNNFCTYCVVPYTRGGEVSRSVKDILEEVQTLVSDGVIEITLLGQNVNSYARTNSVTEDGSPFSFAQLIREVAKVKGLKRLRFTTSNPKDLSDELMRCFEGIDILCPQFHLPVQAGSDKILKKMNRKYSSGKYLQLVETLRKYRPDISITTDIIVGFPGETDADFEETMNLLEKVKFHGSFSFKYSDRPGTKANDFGNKIDEKTKSERLARFQKRQDEISLERNREYIGHKKKILLEKIKEDEVMGRTSTNHIVHAKGSTDKSIGEFLTVSITDAGQHSLRGFIA